MSNFKHLLKHHTPLELQLELTTGKPVEGLYAPIRELHRPYQCPAHLLPYLAYHRGVDFWKDNWPETIKRDVINASVAVHRKKGTRLGVRTGIAATGVVAEIIVDKENPLYVPHTFRVKIDVESSYPSPENISDIHYQIGHTNATRCNYDIAYQSNVEVAPKKRVIAMRVSTTDAGMNYARHKSDIRQPKNNVIALQNRCKSASTHYATHQSNVAVNKKRSTVMFIRIREAA